MKTLNPNAESNLACKSETILLDGRWLYSDVVDRWSEQQQDWIASLQKERVIELYRLNLLGVSHRKIQKEKKIRVSDIIQLTFQVPYQRINYPQQQCWAYSCCLQVVGLGRVRFVICFKDESLRGSCIALLTNRLDWAPSRIVRKWLEHYPFPSVSSSKEISRKKFYDICSVAQG